MSTPTASAGKRQSKLTIPVWPGSLLLLVLVVSGMLIRFWAWVEMVIRILLFQFIVTASGDLLGPQLTFTNLYYDFPPPPSCSSRNRRARARRDRPNGFG